MTYHVAAFYKFISLPDFSMLQAPLLAELQRLGTKGSVLLAEEGINGTIAALPDDLEKAIAAICSITNIDPLECKFSQSQAMPFKRMKVRLKKEIVTMGATQAQPQKLVGTYIEPENWNALISDPNTIVVDTRNAYEVRIGTFRNAIDPQTDHFSQFPAFVKEHLASHKDAKIAMFCTGGIRCEKATSYLKTEGFQDVYHLKGGILKYLENVPKQDSLWQGDCFVFDERVAVGHGLHQSDVTMCFGCLEPVTAQEKASSLYEEGVSCPRCAAHLTNEQKASNRERQNQVRLSLARQKPHLGPSG